MVQTAFTSSTCTGIGKGQGNLTIGGTCNNAGGGSFITATTATTVTQPANSQGQLIWTSPAACNAGTTASGLYAALYMTATSTAAQQCASNNNVGFVCPSALTSSTGGFFVQNYYAAAGCTGTPLATMAMQMGVCQVQSTATVTASSLFVPVTKPNGMTQFNVTYFMGSATCSTGTGVVRQSSVTGFNTTTCKKVAGAMSPSNVPVTGAAFYSISFATTIGFTSGSGIVQYTTAAGCAAASLPFASSVTVLSTTSACTRAGAMTTSSVVAACPAVVTTPSTIYASTRCALVHPHPIFSCNHINSFHFMLLLL